MRLTLFVFSCFALFVTLTSGSDVSSRSEVKEVDTSLVDRATEAIEYVMGTNMEAIVQSVDVPTTLVEVEPTDNNGTSVDCKKKCHKCVKKVASHIITSIVKEIKKACKEAQDPRFKKHCKWIKKHKAQTLGYLVARFEPGRDAYNFCFGAKQCPHPGQKSADGNNETEVAVEEEELDPIMGLVQLEKDMDSQSENEIQSFVQSELGEMNEEDSKQVEQKDDPKCNCNCKKCFRKALKCTVRATIKAVIQKCKETKCPFIKKWCEWARKHKKFVKGYLIGRTKPWKFAAGFCYGRGDCQFGSLEHRAHEDAKLATMFGSF